MRKNCNEDMQNWFQNTKLITKTTLLRSLSTSKIYLLINQLRCLVYHPKSAHHLDLLQFPMLRHREKAHACTHGMFFAHTRKTHTKIKHSLSNNKLSITLLRDAPVIINIKVVKVLANASDATCVVQHLVPGHLLHRNWALTLHCPSGHRILSQKNLPRD